MILHFIPYTINIYRFNNALNIAFVFYTGSFPNKSFFTSQAIHHEFK